MIPKCLQQMPCKQCTYRSRPSAAGAIDPVQPIDHTGISLKSWNDHMKIQKYSDASGQQENPSHNIKLLFQTPLYFSSSLQFRS